MNHSWNTTETTHFSINLQELSSADENGNNLQASPARHLSRPRGLTLSPISGRTFRASSATTGTSSWDTDRATRSAIYSFFDHTCYPQCIGSLEFHIADIAFEESLGTIFNRFVLVKLWINKHFRNSGEGQDRTRRDGPRQVLPPDRQAAQGTVAWEYCSARKLLITIQFNVYSVIWMVSR